MKRAASDQLSEEERATKRSRSDHQDRLSALTNELLLRTLSFLQPTDLCTAQRLSRKFSILSADASLWRRLYFQRFVHPRSSRLPGAKERALARSWYSGPAKGWLGEQHLVHDNASTDWKKQYKLRHNWSCGACNVADLVISAGESQDIVVEMQEGIVFSADRQGLRAWSKKTPRRCLHTMSWPNDSPRCPTTISIDIRSKSADGTHLCVGFDDGTFLAHTYSRTDGFSMVARLEEPQSDTIRALSVAWPLVLILSETQRLRIFDLAHCSTSSNASPRLVHAVLASKPYWPTTVAIRELGTDLLISIAYIEPTYFSGHTVGIQEIRVSDGSIVSSRNASTLSTAYRPLTTSCSVEALRYEPPQRNDRAADAPISLSYTHPYLLVSQPDRTLTLYMVTSTPQAISLSSGRTLWGHGSSVSGAHVGKRGKAVSASKRGDELLIWELERELPLTSAQGRGYYLDKGISAKPVTRSDAQRPLLPPWSSQYDGRETSSWLGFDAEDAVVLRRDESGKHVLTIYNFSC